MPPSVLLTRPQASSQYLAGELKRLGYTAVIEPLLSIIPTHAPMPDDRPFDAVIVTSAKAVVTLEETKQDISPLLVLPCFCVGTHTANEARRYGFRTVQNADGDSGALTHLIKQQGTKLRSFLHIAGSDINPAMQTELGRAGYAVTLWPVYTAIAAGDLSPAVIAAVKQGKLDAMLLFSPRTADILRALVIHHALEACCKDVIGIGISKAVATALRPLTWRKLAAAAQPTEEAVIQKLQTLLPVSGT